MPRVALALALLPFAAPVALADKVDPLSPPASLPEALRPAAGEELAFALRADGVQVYECKDAGGVVAWAFRAPEATLAAGNGDKKAAARHFAGPTWADDAGSVVGTVAAKAPSPDPAAIPWLKLTAASHTGTGRFSEVSTILRLSTASGVAPPAGCDAGKLGAVAKVPYQASYFFYRPARR